MSDERKTIKPHERNRNFDTGAVRGDNEGRGRMDLLPFGALMELSKIFEAGARKYAARNWEKGIPLHNYVDSAMRHLSKMMMGWQDEPHLEQAVWNLICLLQTQLWIQEGLLPESLNDLPRNPIVVEENPNQVQYTKGSSLKEALEAMGE